MEAATKQLISSGVIVAVVALSLLVVQLVSRRGVRALAAADALRPERRQHVITLIQLLTWGATVLIVGAGLLMILSEFGINIAPLLASAGVAGLAVSLGAQTLFRDLIGGLFVLLENQYAVGDMIKVGTLTGTVERLTLRATTVRDVNGNLYTVPNGEVRVVGNQTRDWSRALVDVGVAYEADLERATVVLAEAAQAFAQEEGFRADLLEPPQLLGPLSLGDWAITMRVMVKTRPGRQWAIGRELRKRILAACAEHGIDLPYPRQEILLRRDA